MAVPIELGVTGVLIGEALNSLVMCCELVMAGRRLLAGTICCCFWGPFSWQLLTVGLACLMAAAYCGACLGQGLLKHVSSIWGWSWLPCRHQWWSQAVGKSAASVDLQQLTFRMALAALQVPTARLAVLYGIPAAAEGDA